MISRGPMTCFLGALVSVWLLGCDAEVKKATPRQPTIVIMPSTATIRARHTLEFHAFVTDTAGPVTWSLEITGGTFLEPSEISPNHFTNLFEAPVTGGVYSIFVSTPTTTATATVTVSPPSCRILSTATSTAPGIDAIWGNDDDSYPYFLVTYSYDGDVATYVTYSDPGTDLRWRTSDDTVFGYGTIVMTDSVEVSESYVEGADGIVFTADDLKSSIRITDWGPLGKPHPTSIYPYIDPMYDPNGIGPWVSVDLIFSGDDQDYGTSDDFHLLTRNFHDSRGRLVRQESFRGKENQLTKSGYTQFLIDVASKSSTQIVQEKGNDNLFGTADDFEQANYIYHFADDSFSKVDYSEALWYFDQSSVTSIDRYFYDPWGHLQKIVTFGYRGNDREWLTQDDEISAYTLFRYDEYGIWSRRITYDQPGQDGAWLTDDDVVSKMMLQTYECED